VPFAPSVSAAADAALLRGEALHRQAATLLFERRPGDLPTIVLGGFVPDSTEQVYLLRGMLLRHGSVYYVNYPRQGFSVPMLCAQIDDLLAEIALLGQRPVIVSVSFGSGLLVEWLRRRSLSGLGAPVAGAILVSPVTCLDDIVDPGLQRQGTLLGRALGPFTMPTVDLHAVEKARTIFTKMFEAGANNRSALAGLLGPGELLRLREAVVSALRGIDAVGARERVRALSEMAHPRTWAKAGRPLCAEPVLALYAEREDSVMAASSPTRAELEEHGPGLFPGLQSRIVQGGTSPVQHASLIFHYYQFLPYFEAFYRGLKTGKMGLAA
jgi:hypothetical protein